MQRGAAVRRKSWDIRGMELPAAGISDGSQGCIYARVGQGLIVIEALGIDAE